MLPAPLTLRTTRAAALLSALLIMAACEHPPSNVTIEESATRSEDTTPPVVSLPPAPSAQDFIIKEKNPDGSLRVQGLVEYKDKYLDQEVVVKGKIVKMSELCDPAKAAKENKKCLQPHMLIQDDESDAEKLLMVVGYDADFVKRAKLEEGGVHQITGRYKMMGYGFTASEDGLLELLQLDETSLFEEKKSKK